MANNPYFGKKKIFICLLLILPSGFCFSQDYSWWYTKYNWPTNRPWVQALTLTPGYMGPNALPVPDINTGLIPEKATVKTGLEVHKSKGDNTENAYTEVYLPLFSKRVGIKLNMNPFEHYKMDTLTRDIRKSRDYDGKGTAVGDVYLGTYIQLLAYDALWPDVAVSFSIKTASGSNLDALRYTDTPGYFMDVSLGKNFHPNGFIRTIRPYAMAGFYAYQTYHPIFRQNDCILYGAGVNIASRNIELSNAIGGYRGYLKNGDNPTVYRATLTTKFNSAVNFDLRFQQGIGDFKYTSVRLCCLIDL